MPAISSWLNFSLTMARTQKKT
jgi:hypothetical protein